MKKEKFKVPNAKIQEARGTFALEILFIRQNRIEKFQQNSHNRASYT